ncbi:MAG: hypothetical protein KDA80_24595 [Planctomycetaceae bacterium]|nr:hypothetical protein [Planctomycetaceae bacterium]
MDDVVDAVEDGVRPDDEAHAGGHCCSGTFSVPLVGSPGSANVVGRFSLQVDQAGIGIAARMKNDDRCGMPTAQNCVEMPMDVRHQRNLLPLVTSSPEP